MQEERILLVKSLLTNLKTTYENLNTLAADMENFSEAFYQSFFKENKDSILQEINKYKTNIERIKSLNSVKTSKINDWYSFAKNKMEIKKILFPVKFHIKQIKLKKEIKNINQQIYNLTIENRLIKDNLTNWEHELEAKAIGEIKKNNKYQKYGQLLEQKKEYISALHYLLPTISTLNSVKLDLNNTDQFIKKYLG